MTAKPCARRSSKAPPWQRLDSTVVHATSWFEVRRDSVIRPDGGYDTYMHVVAPGSVTVLAMDRRDRVIVTRQWIYTHKSTQWRLPGGVVDQKDSDFLAAARRELAEEAGLNATHWEPLGQVHGADSLSNHVDHVFFATDLTDCEQRLDPGEADLKIQWVSFDDALDLVLSGELPHAGSSYAVLLMALRRNNLVRCPRGAASRSSRPA
jgi:ADP-ribose pyrophosphatase